MTDEEKEILVKKYFSVFDIEDVYPGNIGLKEALKVFMQNRKIKPDRVIRIKRKGIYFNGKDPVVSLGLLKPKKMLKEINIYFDTVCRYKVSANRLDNISKLKELVEAKIENNENLKKGKNI